MCRKLGFDVFQFDAVIKLKLCAPKRFVLLFTITTFSSFYFLVASSTLPLGLHTETHECALHSPDQHNISLSGFVHSFNLFCSFFHHFFSLHTPTPYRSSPYFMRIFTFSHSVNVIPFWNLYVWVMIFCPASSTLCRRIFYYFVYCVVVSMWTFFSLLVGIYKCVIVCSIFKWHFEWAFTIGLKA